MMTVATVSEHVGLTREQRFQLQKNIKEFSDGFLEKLGRTTLIKRKIKLTTDKPIAPKMHRIPESLKERVYEQIMTVLETEESNSAYASPIVCVCPSEYVQLSTTFSFEE